MTDETSTKPEPPAVTGVHVWVGERAGRVHETGRSAYSNGDRELVVVDEHDRDIAQYAVGGWLSYELMFAKPAEASA